MEKCSECEGEGFVVLILKARSVGMTICGQTPKEKVPCPKCSGQKPWWMKDKAGATR